MGHELSARTRRQNRHVVLAHAPLCADYFSLNYHLGKWTPQQCIDFLVDRVGFERANAEAEVRRSFTANYGPLYQLAYMTGAFQFYALKRIG